MASTEKGLKNKNQNIQVSVRLRPLNQRERGIRSLSVVDVVNSREVVVRQSQQTLHTKKFTFDRAFGPNATQVEVYKEVVSPLIAEVLAGYNCTVFAYGQTGTGKTHTMVGESSSEGTTWQNDPLSGIIPRALSQLFDELRISNSEYTVRVSYLELYNEELFDLLSSCEDNSKLRIYEDVNRKGSTIVNGLEEITVYNKNEVYKIMEQGQERKKVASTLMNAQSSRSHTVFTIVVHIKENCPKGEELVKIGKLNLVDLAGSENISKAGTDNPAKKERARECVNINQSLLTLGRVITALVEKHPHIPYRESKLTRILQESLGGRTKTSIIATVSPGHKDLEETMSTLEYAHRAKNIQNKPEVNQKLTKQAILTEFAEEIDKMRKELTAARERSGVHLPLELYEELQVKGDSQRREIQELLLKTRALEDERARIEGVFKEMEQRCVMTEQELAGKTDQLQRTASKLEETEQHRAEQEHLVDNHLRTESQLLAQAQQLIETADVATRHVQCLHDTVDRRQTVESTNQEVVTTYREESTAQREQVLSDVQQCTDSIISVRDEIQANIDEFARNGSETLVNNVQGMKELISNLAQFMNEIKTRSDESEAQLSTAAHSCRDAVEASARARSDALQTALAQFARAVDACVDNAAGADVSGTVERAAAQWVGEATARVQCLQKTHAAHHSSMRALEARRDAAARAHHRERVARLKNRDQAIAACIAELELNKKAIEERITKQQAMIEADRNETQQCLQRMEDKSRELKERVEQMTCQIVEQTCHIVEQKTALNSRMEHYTAELEASKEMLMQYTERSVRMQQMQLEENRVDTEVENEYLELCGPDREECVKSVDGFAEEFGEGTHAISAEMEAFSHSVVQIVGHATDRGLDELRTAQAGVTRGVETVLATDTQTTQQSVSSTHAAVAAVVDNAKSITSAVIQEAVETSNSTIQTLNDVSERTARLASSLLEHRAAQSGALERASGCVDQLGAGLRDGLQRQGEAERRYLMREYRVYSPSGNTPVRHEFRYPRRLAATSPHERILARFRANRQESQRDSRDSPDSDCIVVESDEARNTSDSDVSESSVSEDSAVAMQ